MKQNDLSIRIDRDTFEAANTVYQSLGLPKATQRELIQHSLIFYALALPGMIGLAVAGKQAGSKLNMNELQGAAVQNMIKLLQLQAEGEHPAIITESALNHEREQHLTQILEHISGLLDVELTHTVENDGRIRVEVVTDASESKQFTLTGNPARQMNLH